MRQNIMNIGKNNRQYFWIGIVMLVFGVLYFGYNLFVYLHTMNIYSEVLQNL